MLDIIYEDNHLIVCSKPFNVPVQEDSSKDTDMLTIIKKYLKDKYDKPGNVFLGLVHRLDRPVGGVMVFAKTSKAASRLSESIRNHKFRKEYLAVIRGKPEKNSGKFIDFLKKDNKRNIVSVVKEGTNGGKESILYYDLIESKFDFKSKMELSLVRINLITGRPHQIRVQFASRGYPLVGDRKYTKGRNKNGLELFKNICLWSYGIRFKHPTRDEVLNFNAVPKLVYPWDIFDYSRLN